MYSKESTNLEEAECAVILTVEGSARASLSEYELVSYTNIQQLVSDRPVAQSINKGDYQYYIFDVDCDNCTVLIGVQSLTGGDPDLYINYGNDNLPDKDIFDFKSTEYGSEVFTLDL